jgi:hypothetical protein
LPLSGWVKNERTVSFIRLTKTKYYDTLIRIFAFDPEG